MQSTLPSENIFLRIHLRIICKTIWISLVRMYTLCVTEISYILPHVQWLNISEMFEAHCKVWTWESGCSHSQMLLQPVRFGQAFPPWNECIKRFYCSLFQSSAFMNTSHIQLSSSASKISSFTSGGLFDFASHQNMSPSSHPSHHPGSSLVNSFPLSPSLGTNLSTEVRNVRVGVLISPVLMLPKHLLRFWQKKYVDVFSLWKYYFNMVYNTDCTLLFFLIFCD